MPKSELKYKLESFLNKKHFDYDFYLDDKYVEEYPYERYVSLTLRIVSGSIKNQITYKGGLTKEIACDISLVNKLVSYLIYYTSTSYNVINLYKLVDLRISRSFKD